MTAAGDSVEACSVRVTGLGDFDLTWTDAMATLRVRKLVNVRNIPCRCMKKVMLQQWKMSRDRMWIDVLCRSSGGAERCSNSRVLCEINESVHLGLLNKFASSMNH